MKGGLMDGHELILEVAEAQLNADLTRQTTRHLLMRIRKFRQRLEKQLGRNASEPSMSGFHSRQRSVSDSG
jgi:hypothetical protein